MCIRDSIGLCAAVEHYDEDKGVAFISYAGFWIKQTMQRLSLIHILLVLMRLEESANIFDRVSKIFG